MNKFNCILLVDDDDVNNYINERLINRLNLCNQIISVRSGKKGINVVKKYSIPPNECPELIFLDIKMPGEMDGFEFMKAFNNLSFENKDKVTIAVLSTSTNPGDIEKMKELGVKHYLHKPLTEQKLTEFINNIITSTPN